MIFRSDDKSGERCYLSHTVKNIPKKYLWKIFVQLFTLLSSKVKDLSFLTNFFSKFQKTIEKNKVTLISNLSVFAFIHRHIW